mmetsp:Transcript_9865/g.13962  ORF Transcript_9865/g.13962 Transcript_9865/m.13962 type:complete len:195 (-) Transcript_9865:274-858(-)
MNSFVQISGIRNRTPRFFARCFNTNTNPVSTSVSDADVHVKTVEDATRNQILTKICNPKFESPRKRANKMFNAINKEAVEKSRRNQANVLQVPFRVGDAIEISMVGQGGVKSKDIDKMRGVVLGRVNRGLGSSVHIRDVVFGEPIDRKIALHSPLLRSLKVLEKNFVFKGKRKVKRAKLYYLRDRLPQETRVTK